MSLRATQIMVATELRRRQAIYNSYFSSWSLFPLSLIRPELSLNRSFVTKTTSLFANKKGTLATTTTAASVNNKKEVHDVQNSSLSEYLEKKHSIDKELHGEMIKAFKSVYGNKLSVENLEAFGGPGLAALAECVQGEIMRKQQRLQGSDNKNIKKSRPMRRSRMIHISIPHHRTSFDLKWKEGDSLLDLAHDNEELLGEYMEGTCGGQMSCCTCHVYLDPDTFASLAPPEQAELDMLDLAHEPRSRKSRLGCQVRLGKGNSLLPENDDDNDDDMDSTKITVTIPPGVNNVWK